MTRLLIAIAIAATVSAGTLIARRGSPAGGGGSPVIPSPVSYWSFDNSEASGAVAVDSEPTDTAQNLTDANSCARLTGKLGNAIEPGAIKFAYRLDSADLSVPNDTSFTIAAWVKADALTNYMGIVTKGLDASIGYRLIYNFANNRFFFQVANGGSGQTISANNLGAPSTATWYYIVAWHDKDANTISIQVNDGAVDSISYTGGTQDEADAFRLGNMNSSSTDFNWIGLIDEVYFGKVVLTAQERTDLYNSGTGYRPTGL
jgi:hypothetical protein